METILHHLQTFDIYYKNYLVPKFQDADKSNNHDIKLDSENEDLTNDFEGFFRKDDFVINYSLNSIKISDLLQIIYTRNCQIIYLETNKCAHHGEKHVEHKIVAKIVTENNLLEVMFSLIEDSTDNPYIMFSFNELWKKQ